ncbi:MAG: hypothetical protein US28_C0003G0006 [Candidatus Daviesbacteria bacterium GW2011_GWA1_36_8]|uniref:Uncharacterized protein n=1 Tax=Candidatus Daviesbacteria bacterium GW2011_GWA1_36_8 TaxID=1618417 RepID=A0A0G0FEA4_9BACT|nr:MAG: hypothetical protein US28_C0003G0006 [Candidatus Daviesbacteria bacterium GW2011_GWA1_36_8]
MGTTSEARKTVEKLIQMLDIAKDFEDVNLNIKFIILLCGFCLRYENN